MVDGRRKGYISLSEIYGNGEFAKIQKENIKNFATAASIASGGIAIKGIHKLPNGKVKVELEGGKSEVLSQKAYLEKYGKSAHNKELHEKINSRTQTKTSSKQQESKPLTKADIQEQLDKMPGGENYFVRKNSDGTLSVVRKAGAPEDTHPIKITEDGYLYTPNAVAKPKDFEDHHYATDKHSKYSPEFKKIVKKYDLDLNGKWNKDLLPHKGRHTEEYHKFVQKGMEQAQKEAGDDKEKFLELFNKYVKEPIRKNPDLMYKKGWQ